MQWKGRRESDRVEDARGESSGGFGGGGGGGLNLLFIISRAFRLKGILAALVIGGVLWKMGIVDPGMLLDGGHPTGS